MYRRKGLPAPVDSILEAVFTVSPNRQYLGIAVPTTPATTGPKVQKIVSYQLNNLFPYWKGLPGRGDTKESG